MGCATSDRGYATASLSQRTVELGSKLGKGSYGEVRALVANKTPRADLAVKVVPLCRVDRPAKPETDGPRSSSAGALGGGRGVDRDLLTQARREARIWKSIGRHEHCVELVCTFAKDEAFLMVMERCRGSLYDARTQFLEQPESRIADVFRQMTRGLAHLHRRRIVHRDVKPENFLLGGPSGSTVKLCDFGLAVVAPASGLLFGRCGTVPYMSPEMLGDVGHSLSTDVWSFGTAVYHMLFEELPYMPTGHTDRFDDTMRRSILLGVPAPSFSPRDVLRASLSASEVARSFARALLRRCVPDRRLTMQQVLHLPLIHGHASHEAKERASQLSVHSDW